MIHSGKDLYMGFGTELTKVPGLWPGHEGFFRTVPIVDIGSVDRLQLMGVHVLVSVADGLSPAVGPHLPAFIQQYVEIVRMEKPFPESGPVVAGPDVQTLIISQRIDAPFRKRQQRSRVLPELGGL